MILSRKIMLKPTEEQEEMLWQSIGTARFIYNWTLDRQETNYKHGGKFISDGDLRKEITVLKKKELSWLQEVSVNVPKQAVKDACNAYKNFFKGVSSKPKFKSRRKSKPSFYNDSCKFKAKKGYVRLEKIGWVSTCEQVPLEVKYYNPRISFDGKYWYISFGVDTEESKPTLTEESLGIDLGIKDLAVCSNGVVYGNINKSEEVRRLEKKLDRLQRQVSRKYAMNKHGNKFVKTRNILKLEEEIRLIHRRLRNIRSNYLHQVTISIVRTKPYRIVIEDLNVRGMMKNRCLSKAIQKQGFYEFRRQIEYKSKMRGIEVVVADRFYPSSKQCSVCGEKKKDLKLRERKYKCESCGMEMDRDLNASINLSKYKESKAS